MASREIALADEQATVALGAMLAKALRGGAVLFLEGPLGAGKTTMVRGLLAALGHTGAVKSPTYTLVEPYNLVGLTVNHFDLYRLSDAEELEYLGIRDYFSEQSVCLIEWPTRGEGVLPVADLCVDLSARGNGRLAQLTANTELGRAILDRVSPV